MNKKILIVDDSAIIRKHLIRIFESVGYEIDIAKNGQEAVDKCKEYRYDAVTMDINMPVMDGLEAIKIIMKNTPVPILVISSVTTEGSSETFEALESGAIDYVSKPGQYRIDVENQTDELLTKLEAVSKITRRRLKKTIETKINLNHDRPLRKKRIKENSEQSNNVYDKDLESKSSDINKIVLIGSSTGGPGLIEKICTSLPIDFPHPVCVVQHMPEQFTEAFASRINALSKVIVKESMHGEELKSGVVYIAKGGIHMHFRKKVSGKIVIKHSGSDTVNRFFTPSVDEMYLSALNIFGANNLFSFILTGIGNDGAEGMVAIHKGGGHTIGENEESCTVYGMPRVAFEDGGISQQMSFDEILHYIKLIRE